MGPFVLTKVAEIALGIGGGVAFEKLYEGAPKGMGFVVALLLFILWELIEAALHAERYHKSLHHNLAKLTESGAKASGDQTLLQLGLTYCGRSIDRADTSDVWNQLTWAVQRSYRATNYIDIRDLYENNYAEDVLSVQKAKVRALANFRIKKVFICDAEAELRTENGRKLIGQHRDAKAPMEIKTLLMDEIEEKALKTIGGKRHLDFAIFDDQVVLIWHLDAKRKILGSEVLVGRETAKKFDVFFEHLFTAGAVPLNQ